MKAGKVIRKEGLVWILVGELGRRAGDVGVPCPGLKIVRCILLPYDKRVVE